jgi:hypothetical protein
VSDDRSEILDGVLAELSEQLEDASLALQQRAEWKNSRALCEGMAERRQDAAVDDEGLAALVREAEASRDLLAIASAEVEHQEIMAERGRAERLAEDEKLLAGLHSQCNRYRALVVASFLIPLFFITWPPASRFVLLSLIPALLGFLKTRAACDSLEGRIWVALQSRVDEGLARARVLHGAALGSAVASLLWFVVALMSAEARMGL